MENQFESKLDKGLCINDLSRDFLMETAKWTKLLSILGFIGIVFMVIGGVLLTTVYLVLAAIYVLPIYYLYNFSKNIKNALIFNNSNALDDAFLFLKSHYKYVGILSIVIISLYTLIVIGMILVGDAAAFASL